MKLIGIDIGGANLKAATPAGETWSQAFPLWQRPAELPVILQREVLGRWGTPDRIALTMTGELCDCFSSKTEGVDHILTAVEQAAGEIPVDVYLVGGKFVEPSVARNLPLQAAASNWHALANFCRRFLEADATEGIVVDIGSTSCDLIPIDRQQVLAVGGTDPTRIAHQELVYTGVARTPVCAVAPRIRFRGSSVVIAQELFATMRDVYLVREDLVPDPGDRETADLRPATIEQARHRLSRMLCADPQELVAGEIEDLAEQVAVSQEKLIADALGVVMNRLKGDDPVMILSGSGSFLAARVAAGKSSRPMVRLDERLGAGIAEVAPAYAVAVLLEER